MDLKQLGTKVEAARLGRRWSKEQAAREAGISSITWKRVEDGLAVQDQKLRAVMDTLGLDGAVGGDEQGYVAAPLDGEGTVTITEAELEGIIRRAVEDARRLGRS